MSKVKIQNRYGVVPNELLNNDEISLKAKGLYAYIQSKPDEWDFSIDRISAQCKEGVEAIRAAIKELEMAGYLKRNNYQNKNGSWDCDYFLYANRQKPQPLVSTKTPIQPHMAFPHTADPHTADPHTGNPHTLVIKNSKQEVVKKNRIQQDELAVDSRIDSVLWAEWVTHRKELRKKLTPTTIKRQVKMLLENEKDHREILTNSIQNGWQGLFTLKQRPFKPHSNALQAKPNKYDKYDNPKI